MDFAIRIEEKIDDDWVSIRVASRWEQLETLAECEIRAKALRKTGAKVEIFQIMA